MNRRTRQARGHHAIRVCKGAMPRSPRMLVDIDNHKYAVLKGRWTAADGRRIISKKIQRDLNISDFTLETNLSAVIIR